MAGFDGGGLRTMRDEGKRASQLRTEVVRLLTNGELAAGQIARKLGCRAPTLSYHLDHMLRLGTLVVEPRGSQRIYRLADRNGKTPAPAPLPPIRVFFVPRWTTSAPEGEADLTAHDPTDLLARADSPSLTPAQAAIVRTIVRSLELEPRRAGSDVVAQVDAGVFKIIAR